LNLVEHYGSWAVVLGASQGLGEAWARGLAARGMNVALVARRGSVLEGLAEELRATYGVRARPWVLDLGTEDLAERLAEIDDELQPGVAVYNASSSPIGAFLDVPLEDKLQVLRINAHGPLIMCDVFGRRFAGRGRGALILMSSMSGFQGSSLVATYAATKAFDTVLGEGLWYELRDRDVEVLVVAAGATLTPPFKAVTPDEKQASVFPMQPDAVVREALAELGGGRPTMIPGRINRLARAFLGRLRSREAAVRFISDRTRNLYGGSTT
jgi:short-subunit dehydrogenase